jgi:hypothetical protein
MTRLRLRWIILAASVSLVSAAAPSKWIEVNGGAWRLDPSVLSEVQAALRSALPTADGGKMRKWDAYTYQYQGKNSVLGNRYVFVNAFCSTSRDDNQMRTEWVEVYDGGTCYFQVEYDLKTKQLRKLQVNGEA